MGEKEKWDELHAERKLHYPNEDVVRFVMRNWQANKEGLIALDLGCGSGRHLVYLAKEGFRVWRGPFGGGVSECRAVYAG